MEMHNHTESVVEEVANELIAQRNNICKCEKCRLDVMLIALNNLPPHYYVTPRGEVFSRVIASYADIRIKVITEVTKAIMIVEKTPHH